MHAIWVSGYLKKKKNDSGTYIHLPSIALQNVLPSVVVDRGWRLWPVLVDPCVIKNKQCTQWRVLTICFR